MTILRPAVVALATGLAVIPAWALEVTRSVEVAAPPDEVWQTIRGFCTIAEWHPMIAECVDSEQNGVAMRTLTTTDGAVLVERRVQYSDEGMSYSYEIVESPLPVADYESTLAVMDGPAGSMITWSGEFDARGAPDATALETIDDIYGAGLEALKARLR
jgi:Polyketide cyclase / dehydrase and lipid transport